MTTRGVLGFMSRNEMDYMDSVAQIEKDLRYISGILKQKGREILSDYGITPPQFLALQWLYEEGDMTIGELSARMYLAFSTTTDLIDRMEKTSLVKRIKNDQDRRVVQIHLLEEGERLVSQVLEKRKIYLQRLLKDYSSEDLLKLQVSLTRLHHDMR